MSFLCIVEEFEYHAVVVASNFQTKKRPAENYWDQKLSRLSAEGINSNTK